jgi:3-hydroxybutyryl-CoA dehydratase
LIQEKKPKEKTFDEIRIGETFSKEIIITNKIIDDFAAYSGDTNPLHVDAEYAKKNGFKDRVAHGIINSCFLSEIIGMHLPGKNSLLIKMDLNFKEPVYSGDQLIFDTKVTSKNFGNLVSLEIKIFKKEKKENIENKKNNLICVFGNIMVKMLE